MFTGKAALLNGASRGMGLAIARGILDRGGSILNTASISAYRNPHKIGGYNISKAAVAHLTRQMASELAPKIRVNAIAPAVVKTRFASTS